MSRQRPTAMSMMGSASLRSRQNLGTIDQLAKTIAESKKSTSTHSFSIHAILVKLPIASSKGSTEQWRAQAVEAMMPRMSLDICCSFCIAIRLQI